MQTPPLNFSGKNLTNYWQRVPTTSEVPGGDMAFLTWADWAEPVRLVSVRVPGKRSLQEVPEDDRKAKIDEARARIKTDGGGVASTESTHQMYREIFLQACHELKIPEGQQFEFDPEVCRGVAAWCLIGIKCAKLDVFTTMLNKERHIVFKDYSRPWYQHPEILRIKRKYEIEKHKDDQAFLLAHPKAAKELRVSIPGNTIEEIVVEGEQLILDVGEEATRKLGHIATILMTLLFVIRASTLGGMVSDEDIWLDASGHLFMIIRFVKC